MLFGVLYSDLAGPSRRHVDWRESVSWRVSVGSWWVLLEVIWNRVPLSCWVGDTIVGRLVWYFSSGEVMGTHVYVHSVWIDELKLEAYNWYWSLVRVAGLVRVACGNNKLNLDLERSVEINCTCTGDLIEGTGFVCWPSRDCVSISPRSCVDFVRSAQAEIVCWFCRDRVSISPDDILEFGSDLRNHQQGGEL